MPPVDVARPDHESDCMLECPRGMKRTTLGRMNRHVGEARYEFPEMLDDVKWLQNHPPVNLHLCREGAAQGQSPLERIIVREPRVDWELGICARVAKVLQG